MQQLSGMVSKTGLSPDRLKIIAIGIVAVLLAVGIGGFFLLKQTATVALFSRPLASEQLTEVETALTSWNLPYTATADNIKISPDKKNELLSRLNAAGVPHNHVASTAETLATVGALTPQSVLDAQAREGLEGDLMLTIRGMDGVADVKVIIAPAQHGFFADEASRPTTASVRLTAQPGKSFNPDEVAGVKALVANAVPGLDAMNVAVVDDRGVALNDRVGNGDARSTEIARSLQSALDGTVGFGKTLVRVNVTTDGAEVQQREVKKTPVLDKAVAADSVSENYKSDHKTYSKVHSNADRGSDYVERSTKFDATRPSRLSVAVFVDRSVADRVDQIKSLAAATVGLEPKRGDVLTVESFAFATRPGTNISVAKNGGSSVSLAQLIPSPVSLAVGAFIVAMLLLYRPLTPLVRDMLGHGSTTSAKNADVLAAAPAAAAAIGLHRSPAEIFNSLVGEPPHTIAAVLGGMPTATAANVLEHFSSEERREIVRRLQRPASPLIRDVQSVARASHMKNG